MPCFRPHDRDSKERKRSCTVTVSHPRAIAIDSKTKEIYVVEGTPHRISVFSDTGKFVKVISLENIGLAGGIAIHEDNIYLTDLASNCIFHFKKETAGIHLVAKHGGYGKFDCPKQLTISSSGDIYIADCWNDRVRILDSNMHYQQQISHHCMEYLEDVKLTADEVYVLCWGTFVHVFSFAGEKIRSLAIPVHGPFFCLGSFGNIFITNRTTDQINVFTKNGTLLNTLVESGRGVTFTQNVQGIALIDDLKLVIAYRGSSDLYTFS